MALMEMPKARPGATHLNKLIQAMSDIKLNFLIHIIGDRSGPGLRCALKGANIFYQRWSAATPQL